MKATPNPHRHAPTPQAFLTIDADQDGFISFNEMEEWWGHDI